MTNVVVAAISTARLRPYMRAADQDLAAALALYDWNVEVAAAMFPLLEALEISVRNGFNDALVAHYGDGWWRPDRSPVLLKGRSLENIDALVRRHKRSSRPPLTTGRFVAEMSFGFWRSLTTNTYDQSMWRPALHTAFLPNPPALAELRQWLTNLNDLRNRIGHHEPVWNRDLVARRQDIVRVLSLIDPQLVAWIRPRLDRFDNAMSNSPLSP